MCEFRVSDQWPTRTLNEKQKKPISTCNGKFGYCSVLGAVCNCFFILNIHICSHAPHGEQGSGMGGSTAIPVSTWWGEGSLWVPGDLGGKHQQGCVSTWGVTLRQME